VKLYEIPTEMQELERGYNAGVAGLEAALEAGDITAETHAEAMENLMDSVAAALDGMDDELSAKIDSIARLVKNKLAESDVAKAKAAPFKTEAKRFTAQADQAKRLADHLKDYAKNQLIRAGKENVVTPDFKVSRQANGGNPSVIALDLDSIPAEFKIPQPDKVNNSAVVEVWKAEGCPGVLGQGKPGEKIAKLEDVPGVEIRRGQHLRIR